MPIYEVNTVLTNTQAFDENGEIFVIFTPGKFYHRSYNDVKQNCVLIQDMVQLFIHTLQTSF